MPTPTGTIELDCPGCGMKLELDAGFAGGVCRCFDCGTLMTVPADPRHERAERLSRPARPDAPGGASAPAVTPSPPSEVASRPEAPTAAGRPETPPGSAPATAAVEQGTYVTESGKQIRITEAASVPTAKRRREAVRFGIVLVFVLVMGAVAAVCVFAVRTLTVPPASPEARAKQATAAVLGYDPAANPFTLETPNVLGLPLERSAIVVVDAGAESRAWIGVVNDAIVAGVAGLPAGSKFQVLYAMERGAAPYPAELKAFGEAERRELRALAGEVTPVGLAPLAPAVKQAVEAGPDQVVLVTGRSLTPEDTAALAEAAKVGSGVRLDVVVVGNELPELRALAEARGGRYVSLPTRRLSEWYRESPPAGDAGEAGAR